MDWFVKFSEFSWYTIAMLIVALFAGGFAIAKREWAGRIMAIAGAAEALIIAAIVLHIARGRGGEAFEGIYVPIDIYALSVVALIAVMLLIMYLSGRKEKWTARDIATAAMVVAMSFLLSYIRLFNMPQGGSVTPASLLPMMIYIVAFGPARGLVIGIAYGLLQLFQGAYVVHPAQLLLDYPMAFGALALGGVVRGIPMPDYAKLPIAIVLGYLGRYIMASLSGAIFFAEYAGEQNAWAYSFIYNISYLGPDALACVAVSLVPGLVRVVEAMRGRRAA
ncbi:MAG: energy-coupled thiamine transporter ThiT [Christensenellales bacterium]|jgi:thiamine transporter